MILDESNEVGKVHLGIAMIARVNGMVLSKEDQIELVGFKSVEEIIANIDSYESWSQIIINHIGGVNKETA